MAQRITITTSNACTPTAHAEGCRDLAKVRRRADYAGEYASKFSSLTELSLDYWTDIIHSDHGLDGAEAEAEARDYLDEIEVAPCVKLPLMPPDEPPAPAPLDAHALADILSRHSVGHVRLASEWRSAADPVPHQVHRILAETLGQLADDIRKAQR